MFNDNGFDGYNMAQMVQEQLEEKVQTLKKQLADTCLKVKTMEIYYEFLNEYTSKFFNLMDDDFK